MSAPALPAFAGFGVELEYMIVDADTLDVRPVADALLDGETDLERGRFGWSNEIVLHLVELKNSAPEPALAPLAAGFQDEIGALGRHLQPLGARLLPTAMHPWMDPAAETRLWPHEHADLYAAYDRVFGCRTHGQANLQSMHLNLPFADDAEFARLHAAARLVLPILPALAASSPVAEGRASGLLDTRLDAYRHAVDRVPAVIGQLVPDTVASRADYAARILAPMFRAVAPFDPAGVLRHEWLNARGAIPRFDRNALEIRVIDVQECPRADLAIAAATTAAIRALYDGRWAPFAAQQDFSTQALVAILDAAIRDADAAVIDDVGYLRALGFPCARCTAGELWRHLAEALGLADDPYWGEALGVILDHGPLARRILRVLGPDFDRAALRTVYRELCACLDAGRLFRS